MCGIFCSVSATEHILPNDEIGKRLESRGPDSSATICTVYPKTTAQKHDTSTRDIHLTFCSTVLSLRGIKTVIQPIQDKDEKYTLCWNGEAWGIGDVAPAGNDTEAIHKLLIKALQSPSSDNGLEEPVTSAERLSKAFSQVAGPYAFVFFDHARGRLFFGRDSLGRRSLLKRITDRGDLLISSISDGDSADNWEEIDAAGIYCIDLHITNALQMWPGPQLQTWGRYIVATASYLFHEASTFPASDTSVVPRLSLNRELPPYHKLLNEDSSAVRRLELLLQESLSLRILDIPEPPTPCNTTHHQPVVKLAVLFSGGLDCTLLARMAHSILPSSEPIDLLNVAFENPRIHKKYDNETNADDGVYEQCPDRLTGRASYKELLRVCPGRHFRFVVINVPYPEAKAHRRKVISLMHPHNTEMDLSIAYALYFAARGCGTVSHLPDQEPIFYTTSARVLLSGLGADEIFGGYQRHTTAFQRNGFAGLLDELDLDVGRLGKRNLGRDDRVMSHWGKEVRLPYLDERLLCWALNVPVTEKCGFGEEEEYADRLTPPADDKAAVLEPGKKVLRCLAWKLGLRDVAREKKRAIQFGARTAKMETGKTKGTTLLHQDGKFDPY